jgi:glycosyltransferase involved in cell wall biosynthesis
MDECSSNPPRISVILTVYKRTRFLPEAIGSVLSQTFKDYELIVADDSGEGAAATIIERFFPPMIRYQRNPTTLGVVKSISIAIEHARGGFIAILNDDDLWEEHLLEKLISAFDAHPECVLAFADHSIMDENGTIDRAKTEEWSSSFGRSNLKQGILTDNPALFAIEGGIPVNVSSLFRKDAIDWSLLKPEVAGAYDYWIGCLMSATRRPLYFVPEKLARWRVHQETETKRRAHDKAANLAFMFSQMLSQNWFPELRGVLQKKLVEALITVGRDKLNYNRQREARACFWKAFQSAPNTRTLFLFLASFLPTGLRCYLGQLRALLFRICRT